MRIPPPPDSRPEPKPRKCVVRKVVHRCDPPKEERRTSEAPKEPEPPLFPSKPESQHETTEGSPVLDEHMLTLNAVLYHIADAFGDQGESLMDEIRTSINSRIAASKDVGTIIDAAMHDITAGHGTAEYTLSIAEINDNPNTFLPRVVGSTCAVTDAKFGDGGWLASLVSLVQCFCVFISPVGSYLYLKKTFN